MKRFVKHKSNHIKSENFIQRVKIIEKSGFFDSSWYLKEYPDARIQNINPIAHYLRFGAIAGNNPSPTFNSIEYIRANPDVGTALVNPLIHYILHGLEEGRSKNIKAIDPNTLDTIDLEDKATNGANFLQMRPITRLIYQALKQRIKRDEREDNNLEIDNYQKILNTGLFDEKFYTEQAYIRGIHIDDPIQHYIENSPENAFSPNRDFDIDYYKEKNPDVSNAGLDHLLHYANYGIIEGRMPSSGATKIRNGPEQTKYDQWIERHDTLSDIDIDKMIALNTNLEKVGKISVLMPIYDPPAALLTSAIESLIKQTYKLWELCLADDASTNPEIREIIIHYAQSDERIKYIFREENGHISRATNSAAEIASGNYYVLMDNDDILPQHSLWVVAYYITNNPHAKLFYSDEDKLDLNGKRIDPYFKGDFDRILMYGHNMFSHLGVYRKDIFTELSGFRVGYEGSQDYDLTLRCMEKVKDSEIIHIPHILYHWRQLPGSTSVNAGAKNYAFTAAKRAINDHFERMGLPFISVDSDVPGVASIRATQVDHPQTISIVIPTKDQITLLQACLNSIFDLGDPLIEIIVVNNMSNESESIEYLSKLPDMGFSIKVVDAPIIFNFSELCNIGVHNSSGDVVCLLNNDTEFGHGDVFQRARAWLSDPEIGVVGARLLFPDRTIQHFGLTLGCGEHKVAVHSHYGLGEFEHAHHSRSILAQQFSAVTGACMFIKKSLYDKVGGYNEMLPIAYNDVDFCLRVSSYGFKIICDPGIKLVHKESRSRGKDTSTDKLIGSIEKPRLFTLFGLVCMSLTSFTVCISIKMGHLR